jgi:hypothetical protein
LTAFEVARRHIIERLMRERDSDLNDFNEQVELTLGGVIRHPRPFRPDPRAATPDDPQSPSCTCVGSF